MLNRFIDVLAEFCKLYTGSFQELATIKRADYRYGVKAFETNFEKYRRKYLKSFEATNKIKEIDINQVIVQELKNGQLVITIPRAIEDIKGWKKGTVLEYIEDRYGSMTIQEVRE